MTDYYIAKDGFNDTDRGTAESPAATVSYVIETLGAGTGDTLYFFAGTYSDELAFNKSASYFCRIISGSEVVAFRKAPNEQGSVIFKMGEPPVGDEPQKTIIRYDNVSGVPDNFVLLEGIRFTYPDAAKLDFHHLWFQESIATVNKKVFIKNCIFDFDYPDRTIQRSTYDIYHVGQCWIDWVYSGCTFIHKDSVAMRVSDKIAGEFTIENCNIKCNYPAGTSALEDQVHTQKFWIETDLANHVSDTTINIHNNTIDWVHGDASSTNSTEMFYLYNNQNVSVRGNTVRLSEHDNLNDQPWYVFEIKNNLSRSTGKNLKSCKIYGNKITIDTSTGQMFFLHGLSSELYNWDSTIVEDNIFQATDTFDVASSRFFKCDYIGESLFQKNIFRGSGFGIRMYSCDVVNFNKNVFENIGLSSSSSCSMVDLRGTTGSITSNTFILNPDSGEGCIAISTSNASASGGVVTTAAGFNISNNCFVVKNLLTINKSRAYLFAANSGIQHQDGGSNDNGIASTIENNIYYNTDLLNNAETFATVNYLTDSTVQISDWITSFEPTAITSPSFMTKGLIRDSIDNFQTKLMTSYK